MYNVAQIVAVFIEQFLGIMEYKKSCQGRDVRYERIGQSLSGTSNNTGTEPSNMCVQGEERLCREHTLIIS